MSERPSTTREALLAELLGDVQTLLTRLEQADQSAQATATAVIEATKQYREHADDMVNRLRTETAAIVLKTTEHAAKTLVSQQTTTLRESATKAMQQAISEEVLKRTRRDWLAAAVVGAVSGSLLTATLLTIRVVLLL